MCVCVSVCLCDLVYAPQWAQGFTFIKHSEGILSGPRNFKVVSKGSHLDGFRSELKVSQKQGSEAEDRAELCPCERSQRQRCVYTFIHWICACVLAGMSLYLTDDTNGTMNLCHVTQKSRRPLSHNPQCWQEPKERGRTGLGHVHQYAQQGLAETLVFQVIDQLGHPRAQNLCGGGHR